MHGWYFGVWRRPRHLLWSALLGAVVMAALALSYRQLGIKSILDTETRSNAALGRILARAVWPRVEQLAIDSEAGRRGIFASTELTRLRRDLMNHLHDTRIVKINLYDPDGTMLVSTDAAETTDDGDVGLGIMKAQRGEVTGVFAESGSLETFADTADRHIIISDVPVSGLRSDDVPAVLEVFSDVTEPVNAINRNTAFVLLGLLGGVAALFTILTVAAGRMNRVVREEHQQRIAAEAKMRYQAYHDRLTGLPNRRSFYEKLDALLAQPANGPQKLAVMFLDLDNFKLINDGFGHSAGDDVLRTIAHRLSDCLRLEDRLYHMNGDKFIIVLNGNDVRQATRRVAERVLMRMTEAVPVNEQPVTVTCSIGISMYPDDGQDGEQLLKAADSAMYSAKDSGRNQYQFHRPGGTASAIERLALESDLRRAAGSNQFTLHYQPRISVASGEIVAVEALIRWPRPDKAMMNPKDIIPFLERNGLIENVGRWVLQSACAQLRTWRDDGIESLRVSVNVSPRQFLRPGFVEMVEEIITQSGIPATHVELELTESMLIDTDDDTSRKLKRLQDLGVIVTMDDFGTGYSSLNYLRCMSINYLKMDKTFVARITDEPKDAAVASSILTLAHKLGVHVVAEGVETHRQLEFLRAHGCEEYQGFLYSKPVPASGIKRLVQAANSGDRRNRAVGLSAAG